MQELYSSLDRQTGVIVIDGYPVSLTLGEQYYFVGGDDAQRVLTEAWGNPAAEADRTLGIILPVGKTIIDDTWVAIISYPIMGRVSDLDSATLDPARILATTREAEEVRNASLGMPGEALSETATWIREPQFDPARSVLTSARLVRFRDGSELTTFDAWILGRAGALRLQIIPGSEGLQGADGSIEELLEGAQFDQGHRYADYQPDIDGEAQFNLSGLAAGGLPMAQPVPPNLGGSIFLRLIQIGFVVALFGGGIGILARLRRKMASPGGQEN